MAAGGEGSKSSTNRACVLCLAAVKWIPVLFLATIIGWSYYAYVVQLCFLTVTSNVERVLYLVGYHVSLIIFVWSYWQTIVSDSGKVPPKFRLPYSEMEKLEAAENDHMQRQILERFAQTLPVTNRTVTKAVRFCDKCQHIKPDRAHHCSVCGQCVLKMDHHCPWVNNCVSFTNYKFFILFLGYALIYCLFITLTSVQYFIKFWKGELKGMGKFNIVFLFFVAVMFAVSLLSLFCYHCYLVIHNRTTLDVHVVGRSRSRNNSSLTLMLISVAVFIQLMILIFLITEAFRAPVFLSGPDKDGFSLGAYNNFQEVFGDDQRTWFLPIFTSMGDGITFPVRSQHQANYDSMGSTHNSLGDGVTYPQRSVDEDCDHLLGTRQRWTEEAEFESPPFPSAPTTQFMRDPAPV